MHTMVKYTVLTVLSAIGCSLLGYLFLPFASAFYAAILIYERPSNRIFSYVLPVVVFVINFLLRGFYSLEAIAYLVVALVIFICVKRNKSKGETAFWISFALLTCMALSALLLVVELSNEAGYNSANDFFKEYYHRFKDWFIETVTSLVHDRGDDKLSFVFNTYEAEMLFRELVIYAIPMLFLVSFTLTGLTLKLFQRTIEKNSDENCEIGSWNFGTSNLVSYFYIVLSIIALVASSDGSGFAFVIFTLNTIFTAVYAYIGIKVIYYIIISRGKSMIFAIILLVLIFALLSSFAFQLISYFGVIINILTNKAAQNKQKGA